MRHGSGVLAARNQRLDMAEEAALDAAAAIERDDAMLDDAYVPAEIAS